MTSVSHWIRKAQSADPKLITLVIFIAFFLFRLFLINFNFTEWGDSYRILRASEFIRHLTYPADEKRPPLFSLLLALRPETIDQIFWGRLFVFADSLVAFFIFYKICLVILPDSKKKHVVVNLALILYALNPVILYWSLRIYADVPLMTLVLLVFYLLYKWRERLNPGKTLLLGFLAGLGVLTRFEGYILFGSAALGILFLNTHLANLSDIKGLLRGKPFFIILKKRFGTLIGYFAGFAVTVLPYLIFRNPLTSPYFEETSGRSYDFNMVAIYTLSLLFIFGFAFGLFFLAKNSRYTLSFYLQYFGIAVFLVAELALIFLWPAAIPRLFVQVIPFLIILLAISIESYFDETARIKKTFSGNVLSVLFLAFLLAVYIIGQYFYKLQFLGVMKNAFAALVIIQALLGVALITGLRRTFYFLITISCLVWSLTTLWVHRDVYKTIKLAAVAYKDRSEGKIIYNDVSSVAMWYLGGKGVYCDFNTKSSRITDCLKRIPADYVLVTNEHNPDLTFDVTKYPNLRQTDDFEFIINGRRFFTRVYEVLRYN